MAVKNMALLGFLPDIEVRLKEIVESGVSVSVSWVSATAQHLDGVIINANFLATPQIERYIQTTSANVVCCYRDKHGQKQAKDANIVGLDAQRHTNAELGDWLSSLSGEKVTVASDENSDYVDRQLEEILAFNTVNQKKKAADTAPVTTRKDTITSIDSADYSDDYHKLLKQLASNEALYLHLRNGDSETWIDTKGKMAYINYERSLVPSLEKSEWSVHEELNYDNTFRKIQLELWLFEAVWLSDIIVSEAMLSDDSTYQLTRWPRPLSSRGRSEALRLAAFSQSNPVSIEGLQQKTGYQEKTVRRFLYAAKLVDQVKMFNRQDAVIGETDNQRKPDKVKLGVLSRLRNKLFGKS